MCEKCERKITFRGITGTALEFVNYVYSIEQKMDLAKQIYESMDDGEYKTVAKKLYDHARGEFDKFMEEIKPIIDQLMKDDDTSTQKPYDGDDHVGNIQLAQLVGQQFDC